jgi:nitroreductase
MYRISQASDFWFFTLEDSSMKLALPLPIPPLRKSLLVLSAALAWLPAVAQEAKPAAGTDLISILPRVAEAPALASTPIPEAKLETLARAAMAAPTAVNRQPWVFYAVTRPDRLAALDKQLGGQGRLAKAPAAVVVCGDLRKALSGKSQAFWIQDATAAAQNLRIAATALGFANASFSILPDDVKMEAVSTILSLPETQRPLLAIALGNPAAARPAPAPFWEPARLHWNGWTGRTGAAENPGVAPQGQQTALEVIQSRKSVRHFIPDKPVGDMELETVVRAAMAAPAWSGHRSGQFVVVTDRKLLDALKEKLPFAQMLGQAAAAIVVCGEPDQAAGPDLWIQDAAAAAENLLLAAEALGLGAVWTGVYPSENNVAAVREIIGLPKTVEPLCVIPIGHPVGDEKPKDKWQPANYIRVK